MSQPAVCVVANPVRALQRRRSGQGRLQHGIDRIGGGGRQAILAALEIWRDDVNGNGGLLDRPVELVYYDDQSNPSTIPGIYTTCSGPMPRTWSRLRCRDFSSARIACARRMAYHRPMNRGLGALARDETLGL